jgi:hypothetical protein
VTLGEQPIGGGEVAVEALALEVRTFVPVESQPAQGRLDTEHPFLTTASDIGVLDAKHQGAVFA